MKPTQCQIANQNNAVLSSCKSCQLFASTMALLYLTLLNCAKTPIKDSSQLFFFWLASPDQHRMNMKYERHHVFTIAGSPYFTFSLRSVLFIFIFPSLSMSLTLSSKSAYIKSSRNCRTMRSTFISLFSSRQKNVIPLEWFCVVNGSK